MQNLKIKMDKNRKSKVILGQSGERIIFPKSAKYFKSIRKRIHYPRISSPRMYKKRDLGKVYWAKGRTW